MFYMINISVIVWVLNNNKFEWILKFNEVIRNYRNRKDEILFMDLREMGVFFEKKFI